MRHMLSEIWRCWVIISAASVSAGMAVLAPVYAHHGHWFAAAVTATTSGMVFYTLGHLAWEKIRHWRRRGRQEGRTTNRAELEWRLVKKADERERCVYENPDRTMPLSFMRRENADKALLVAALALADAIREQEKQDD